MISCVVAVVAYVDAHILHELVSVGVLIWIRTAVKVLDKHYRMHKHLLLEVDGDHQFVSVRTQLSIGCLIA